MGLDFPTLLTLPAEIRQKIFKYLFRGVPLYHRNEARLPNLSLSAGNDYKRAIGILASCKLCYQEALPIALGSLLLNITWTENLSTPQIRDVIPARIRSNLRSITLLALTRGQLTLGPSQLRKIFPRLEELNLGVCNGFRVVPGHIVRLDDMKDREIINWIGSHARDFDIAYDLKEHERYPSVKTYLTVFWNAMPGSYDKISGGIFWKNITILFHEARVLRYMDHQLLDSREFQKGYENIQDFVRDIALGHAKMPELKSQGIDLHCDLENMLLRT